jgi:peptidoglycan/xylan/chitin deacetylase (PgdA/CDA1 family)
MCHGFLRSLFHALRRGQLITVALAASLVVCVAPIAAVAIGPDAEASATKKRKAGTPPEAHGIAVADGAESAAPQCAPEKTLAGRELRMDFAGGPRLGALQFPESLPLQDKEVVLTFDDGPHPVRTPAILDVLDSYCVKAVFFIVGRMALEQPEILREIARRGHVIGAHSFSHPRNLARLGRERANAEIEMGFAAVSHALGGPVAPLFRFPGLNHSDALLSYLAERNISAWSVDVVSGDTEFGAVKNMPRRLFSRLEKRGRGIILFHDTKRATAGSLASILDRLKAEGYSVARMEAAPAVTPDVGLMAAFDAETTHSRGPVHRVAGKFGSDPAAIRPSGRLRHARRGVSVFREP